MHLAGQAALVTGAAHRLGATIAHALANAGCHVAVHYGRSREGALATCARLHQTGVRAEAVHADLADPHQAAATVERAAAALNLPITLLINSAAIFEPGRIDDTALEAWQRHLAINLTAPFLLTRALVHQLPPQAPGRIVNLLDRRVTNPPPGHLAYTTAKSALWSFTRMAARELAPRVLVNAVGPGAILPAPGDPEEKFRRIAEATPMGRAGDPGEVADAVLFLLQHDYITGQLLCVDGGEHLPPR